jgi:hypothetical protein
VCTTELKLSGTPEAPENTTEVVEEDLITLDVQLSESEPGLPAAPVDMGYLQGLLESEGFGPPKFEVAKPDEEEEEVAEAALEDLIEQELGPPKFAVRKVPEEVAAPEGGEALTLPNKRHADEDEAAPTAHHALELSLEVTAGPAIGIVFYADNHSIEVGPRSM